MIIPELAAAFGIGLAGAGHCLGMCGGISSALGLGGVSSPATTFAYHGGRVASYTMLGAVLGAAAGSINIAPWTIGLRYLAGFLMISMGLSIGNWWNGISVLERAGAVVWQPVQRLSKSFIPVRHPGQALALGACWGLMPCGLIYSALAFAATAQDSGESALRMLAFGVGTLPAMVTVTLGARSISSLLRATSFRRLLAILLIIAGAWSLWITWSHSAHLLQSPQAGSAEGHSHSHHQHH